jgi:hypothetical protein
LDVVEDDGERSALRHGLEESTDGPKRLVGGPVVADHPEKLGEPSARLGLALAQHRADLALDLLGRVEVVQTGCLLHHLAHREEGDPVAVREAPAAEHRGAPMETADELLRQA